MAPDLQLFLISLTRYSALAWYALSSPFRESRSVPGTVLVVVLLPFFIALQLLHWLTFLLDEVLFRGYRKVTIREPVFVLGPPRSGTTHLHRLLSKDETTTTFRAWECLFGLSVTSRKIILGFAAIDRALGRPLGKTASWLARRWLRATDEIHPLRLNEPEEDFLCLMPIAACFLLIVPFPRASWLWEIARFDTDLDDREKRRLLAWYRTCIQKHLYVFGPEKRFVSKNASFSGMGEALLDEFAGSRILFTMREPLSTVPSQLSSLRPAMTACGFPGFDPTLRDRLMDLLLYYYVRLSIVAETHPDRVAMVYNADLRNKLVDSVLHAMASVGLGVSDQFRAVLLAAADGSRQFQSAHRYSLEEFDLNSQTITTRFAKVYELYDFAQTPNGQTVSR